MKVQNSIIALIIVFLFASCSNGAQKAKDLASDTVAPIKKISQILVEGNNGEHKYSIITHLTMMKKEES